jgi:glycosyltransferase involved in cell wall biosynthesis
MKKKKLIIVLEATLGGTRRHVLDLLQNLNKDIFDITFVYSKERADETFLLELPHLEGISCFEIFVDRKIHLYKDIVALKKIIQLFFRLHPDIVYLNAAKAGVLGRIACKLTKVKRCFYNPHGGSFHQMKGLSGYIYRTIERFLVRWTYGFVGVSQDACKLIHEVLLVDERKIRLIYNGIADQQCDYSMNEHASALREELTLNEDKIILLYPALFLETKGHIEFIEAMGRQREQLHEEFVVICAGNGPLLPVAIERVRQHKLEAYFRFVNFQKKIQLYYIICDGVLLLSRAEAFGYVLLEAMQYSKPIFATRIGGIPELVTNGRNGHLIDVDHIETIFDLLLLYKGNKNHLMLMGEKGRMQINNKFLLENMIKNYEELFLR